MSKCEMIGEICLIALEVSQKIANGIKKKDKPT
jgi:hypothetical protein